MVSFNFTNLEWIMWYIEVDHINRMKTLWEITLNVFNLLQGFYQPFTSKLLAFYQHFTSILPAFYQHFTSILPAGINKILEDFYHIFTRLYQFWADFLPALESE